MTYVDGFLIAAPITAKDAYLEMARGTSQVFLDHGARRVVECCGDDVPEGKVTSFGMAVKREDHEVVWFSWVEWESKAARDAGMQAAMSDPRMDFNPADMPFDGQRMIFGGFQMMLDESRD